MYSTIFSHGIGWIECSHITNTASNNIDTFVQSNKQGALGQQQNCADRYGTFLTQTYYGVFTVHTVNSAISACMFDYGNAISVPADNPTFPLDIGLIKANGGSLGQYGCVSG